MITKVGI